MTPESFSTFKPHLQYREYPEYTEMLDKRMKASHNAAENEHIFDICEKDSKVLRERNITHGQIADKLEAVLQKAEFLFSRHHFNSYKAIIDDTLRVEVEWRNWSTTCHFSRDHETLCGTGFNTYKIINLTSNKCLSNVSDLHIHMIRDHYFFQGTCDIHPKHASYIPSYHNGWPPPQTFKIDRVDPELAIDVLGIQPGIDYKVHTITQTIWNEFQSSSLEKKHLQAARKNHLETYTPESKEFEAYVLPYKYEKYPPDNSTETYLHIFSFKASSEAKTHQFGNTMIISRSIHRPNRHSVCKMIQLTGPMLGKGDRILLLQD